MALLYSQGVVTDLVQIQRLGEKKRAENENLRRHMKRHDFVERKFRHMAEEIQDQIDCTTCGNCCKVATTPLQQRDIERLAKFLRIPAQRFLNEYCMESEEEGIILKRSDETGCIFLDGTICSVYEARPSTCEDFPHLVRGAGSLQSRMWQMIDRACYCPIVYNALEAYKEDLGIKR